MGGKSSQEQKTVSDSMNSSLDQVLNVTDTGNIKINLGDAAVKASAGATDWVSIGPIVLLAAGGVALVGGLMFGGNKA